MAKRKRKTPDDEPLFETLKCKMKGCKLDAVPDGVYCAAHEMMVNAAVYLKENGRRALARGDWSSSFLHGLGGVGIDIVKHAFSRMSLPDLGPVGAFVPPPPPPPPPTKSDPFAILGLDPTVATIEDVRRMQRELSKLYHTDKGDSHVASSKLAEINAAAADAISLLRQQKSS
jgi:hypothetical protein